jgi:hypothetical protein
MQAGLAPFFMRPPARQKPNASNNRGGVLDYAPRRGRGGLRAGIRRTKKRRLLPPISVTQNGT